MLPTAFDLYMKRREYYDLFHLRRYNSDVSIQRFLFSHQAVVYVQTHVF